MSPSRVDERYLRGEGAASGGIVRNVAVKSGGCSYAGTENCDGCEEQECLSFAASGHAELSWSAAYSAGSMRCLDKPIEARGGKHRARREFTV